MSRKRKLRTRPGIAFETLEPRHLLAAQPVITEFLASNNDAFADGDGNSSDWIEIYNAGDMPVDLANYRLTDAADNLSRWTFPKVNLKPRQYLVVHASGQEANDYVDAAGNLHTNFRLNADGEYLALVSPDGSVVSEFGGQGADYPPQLQDVSYGFGQTARLVDVHTQGEYLTPLDDSLGMDWTQPLFDAAARGFFSGPAAVGYESRPNDRTNFADEILTTLPAGTHAVYARFPFEIDDASTVTALKFRLKYDNGFVAYLNGAPIAEENVPANPNWISTAPSNSPRDSRALEFVEFDLSAHVDQLVDGQNVLAIHGLNNLSDVSDFLLVPELIADRPISQSSIGYLPAPTPGAPNFGPDAAVTGPLITDVTDHTGALDDGQDLVVTATLTQLNAEIASVSLSYRVMFDEEVTLALVDDGSGADSVASDGVYTATIPHTASEPGQMLRWSVMATDTLGGQSRAPHFLTPARAPEYFGTLVVDPSVTSEIPILHWYLEPGTERAADRVSGTRASLFYDGEFYDNVFVRLRGGSSANQIKKSYKFDLNPGHHFRFDVDAGRVSEINVNTTYSNKDYVRQALTFETFDAAGAPGSVAFPLRVQRNGEFFSVAIFVEQPDADLLRREGLDPDGALYKMFNTFTSATNNVEKKTRRGEDHSDLRQFIDAVNGLEGTQLRDYVFDNVNLPAVMNYLAASVITQNNDQSAKNYYLYRDTEGTGEWLFLPWDLDLTFGLHFMTNDSILDDQIWADKDGFTTFAGVRIWPSHPFFADQKHPGNRSWNRLIDALYEIPEFREMYLRRLRSLMDELLQPPGTPEEELKFEARLDQFAAQSGPDVALDYQRWANPWRWGEDLNLQQAMDRLKEQYFAVRRVHLYQTHSIDNAGDDIAGIPHAQVGNPWIELDPMDFDVNPAAGNQDEEYLKLNNPHAAAVDISGWQLRGGVEHVFKPGTVIPSGGSLYVSPDVATFRARATGPSAGQGLLLQGDYVGHLSNFGETIQLVAADGTEISSLTTPFVASEVQQYLRITELHYNPANRDELEFVELTNTSRGAGATTLDLNGVKITEGPSTPFAFAQGTTLAPGDHVLVVKDQAAFQAAYPLVDAGLVVGQFEGSLNNAGERIKLEDATGSTVLDFEFSDQWYLETDGGGFSLVMVDTAADYNDKANWRPSVVLGGSPGSPEPFVPQAGDANRDREFNQQDIVTVLQGGKYLTGQPAVWAEGDFDGDGSFDQKDIVAALQTGNYLQGPYAADRRLERGHGTGLSRSVVVRRTLERPNHEVVLIDELFGQWSPRV